MRGAPGRRGTAAPAAGAGVWRELQNRRGPRARPAQPRCAVPRSRAAAVPRVLLRYAGRGSGLLVGGARGGAGRPSAARRGGQWWVRRGARRRAGLVGAGPGALPCGGGRGRRRPAGGSGAGRAAGAACAGRGRAAKLRGVVRGSPVRRGVGQVPVPLSLRRVAGTRTPRCRRAVRPALGAAAGCARNGSDRAAPRGRGGALRCGESRVLRDGAGRPQWYTRLFFFPQADVDGKAAFPRVARRAGAAAVSSVSLFCCLAARAGCSERRRCLRASPSSKRCSERRRQCVGAPPVVRALRGFDFLELRCRPLPSSPLPSLPVPLHRCAVLREIAACHKSVCMMGLSFKMDV